jgi:hypothetical protein
MFASVREQWVFLIRVILLPGSGVQLDPEHHPNSPADAC